MPAIITKIKLINYKRFKNYVIEPKPHINILIGDNESGKSSILQAIDIVASGNVHRVETIGLDRMINIEAVQEFNASQRTYDNLPKMIIELYLNGEFAHDVNGKNNSDRVICDGIKLVCESNPDFQNEITESLKDQDNYFPYDYYKIRFSTFADEGYTGYKKKLRSILIDSTNMNSDYATNDFIKRTYFQYTEDNVKERAVHKGKYRQMRDNFRSSSLQELNSRIPSGKSYAFGLKASSAMSLEDNLMIYEDEIGIDSKGTGKQVFIKTDFALERSGTNMDAILIEEPENHLSHVNLRKLVQRVADARNGQLFITTHNSLISTRLELQNLIIMGKEAVGSPVSLQNLDQSTAKYFMKAPVANIVEFATSRRVILVEGPSEYMLFEKFYITETGHKPEQDDVHIIDVRGLSFKRYLEIARLIHSKVAVVTDNDGNKQKNCIDKYSDFAGDADIEIFSEDDNKKRTFEIVLYNGNKKLCDGLFNDKPLDYMLGNKTEAAYTLLEQTEDIVVPDYIKGAIEWIRK